MSNCLYWHTRTDANIDTAHTLSLTQQLTDWTTEDWTELILRRDQLVGWEGIEMSRTTKNDGEIASELIIIVLSLKRYAML